MLYLSLMWVLTRIVTEWEALHLHSTAVFYYCILAVLLGAQMLLAGLLAELIVSLSRDANVPYSISKHLGGQSSTDITATSETSDTDG